jgi:mannan endo-1,4-beta-mannosidase
MSSANNRLRGILCTTAVLSLTACVPVSSVASHGSTTPSSVLTHGPSRPPMIGVYEPYAPGSYWQIPRFAKAIGRWPQIVSYYSQWGLSFATRFAVRAHKNGAETLVQIDPRDVSIAAIASGRWDRYLRQYAVAVRRFRHQVIISFGQEMNGSWYPWGWTHVTPAIFVAAWRHIVTLFTHEGAKNATWLWDVNHIYPQGMAPLAADWPGAAYVDWVGLDCYLSNSGSTYANTIAPDVRQIEALTGKPILLAETAVGARLRNAPGKIRGLFAGVRRDHLLGLVWFDVKEHGSPAHQDWRLEDNPAALAAFRTEAAS